MPPDFTICTIDLDFELDRKKTRVTAKSHIKKCNSNVTDLRLDGEDLSLVEIKIDDKPWREYHMEENHLIILGVPDEFILTIVTKLCPENNTTLEGLYLSGDAFCTQCEAEGFRHITYYLDRPDVLAEFTVKITADKGAYPYLLSNGNRVATGEASGGKHWVQWHDPFPKPSYLFALVAGDFDVMKSPFETQSRRKITLEIYVDKGNIERATWAMESLKNAMKWDETRFGLEYDLDVFMIVAVDFFNMGAMENKGLNIFNSKYVLADPKTATDDDYLSIEAVIGHEYFHNWTGNRVTCRDWFQLSLKEGLTVFRDQEFSSDLGSRSVNRINNVRLIRSAQFTEDAGPMSHPIRPEKVIEMNNFYTVTVYEKGAEVIRMIHTLLGEEKFQAGMRCYFERHDGLAATCDDFVDAMETVSGLDLSQFRLWYSQSGTPELTVGSAYDPEVQTYQLTVTQTTQPTADQPQKQALHLPLNIELYDKKGQPIPLKFQGKSHSSILSVTKERQTFVFDEIAEKPSVSLLREFSAPVKLHYNYSNDELRFLLQHATNDFSRYDAAQRLYYHSLMQNINRIQQNNVMLPLANETIAALRSVLQLSDSDPAMAALILTPPGENEIANQMKIIDPDAIHQARHQLIEQLALGLAEEWQHSYDMNKTGSYRIDHTDIGKRSLKNLSLFYLAHQTDKDKANHCVVDQYRAADNMTDKLAALSAAVKAQLPCAEALMTEFDIEWHHDGLVMDKWFMLHATNPQPCTLVKIEKLLSHRAFSLANPNRVRSLIGTFASGNPVAFHAKTGEGYRFLTQIITELNAKNPQVAARLIDPLIRYAQYDKERRAQMRAELKKLLSLEGLSNDLYEKISKALATETQVISHE